MMSEVRALEKHPCPECGGDTVWNAKKQALACPYCGALMPGELGTDGQVVEHDLAATIRKVSDADRGWKEAKLSVKCESCQAISVFDADRVAQRCDFCGSPSIIPHQESRAPIRPESLLPFKVTQVTVRETIRKWYGSRWFAPNRIKKAALTDTLKGVYLPYWTFDAHANAHWTADAGYYYYVSESYTDSQGKRKSRRVRKIRWVPASGSLNHFFDDTLVSGTIGVNMKLLSQIEPYPTDALVPYDAGFIRGWVVERYQVDLTRAASVSQAKMDDALRAMCAREVPGDTHRNLRVSAHYANRTFKHVLFPVWLLTYNFGRKAFQVLVNGHTGEIAGQRPYSWIKISLAVLTAAAVIGLIAFFVSQAN